MSEATPVAPAPERARFEALLGAVHHLIQDAAAPTAMVSAGERRAWLEAQGLHADDVEALSVLPPARLLLYRKLVRRTLRSAIRQEVPRTAARLGAAFDAYAERWFDAELPRSHYLRDVAFEMIAWVLPRWAADPEVPAWLGELAQHELVEFTVATAPAPPARPDPERLALDRGLAFHEAARVLRYRHAVHTLSAELAARDEPPARETALFAYRDREGDVRWLELSPLAARLVERALSGETLQAALAGACADTGDTLRQPVLEGAAQLLADLAERGALLGSAR